MEKFNRYYLATDDNFNVIHVSRDFLEYIGKNELKNLDKIVPDLDMTNLRNVLFATAPGESSLICFRVRTRSGELSWIASTMGKPVNDGDIIKMDLSDIQSIKTGGIDSRYDKMTGLYSKSAIIEYAKDLMSQTPVRPFYFFIMDIDHFKSINDSYGHLKGDEVIASIAQITRDIVGSNGTVGRFGGDEFMLVLENVNTEDKLREILRNIRYTVRERYMDEKENKTITVSMGGALFPDYADNYESMFMLADKMLYLAKTKGRDRYIFYTPSVHGTVHLDGKVMTITQHLKAGSSKGDLIMELMDSFLIKKNIHVQDALSRMLTTYDLDEVYLLGEKELKSSLGLKAIYKENETTIVDAELDLTETVPEDFHPSFNHYPISVVNIFDLQKEGSVKFAEYMIKHEYRVIIVYHRTLTPGGGYIIYCSTANSSCRLSETDFTDITYFSRMVELSGQ